MQTILDQQQMAGRAEFPETGKEATAVPGGCNANASGRAIIEAMVHSKIYRDYEKVFTEETGMPVALRPVESRQLPQHGKCVEGISQATVPVRLGDRIIGFLQETQRDTKTVSTEQHESAVRLLSIFAQHIALLSNHVVVPRENSEPSVITRAKEYIHEHQTEELSLGQVAKAVNTSTFYFCKMFKKVTGINFTDYLSQVRIENAKNLLLNPNLRVSEIAFEVGFQSLTHFNRVFKRILGRSPTQYRAQMLGN